MARPPHIIDHPNLSSRRVARLRAAFWAVENALLARAIGRARRTADAPPANRVAPPDIEPPPASHRSSEPDRARVLRWVFSRGRDLLTCELALSDDDACYELRTLSGAAPSSRSIERFADVTVAFQRQSALEGRLVADGWSLDAYESIVVERRQPLPIAL